MEEGHPGYFPLATSPPPASLATLPTAQAWAIRHQKMDRKIRITQNKLFL